MPPPPIKCAGAPQKIMYLADDYWRRSGVRDKTKIVYVAGTPSIFSVKEYAATLDRVCARGIVRHFKHKLVELCPERARRLCAHPGGGGHRLRRARDAAAPDVVKKSALADAAGWVEVNKATLQHARFPNVFSLGDASSLPTSRTGARSARALLVANLLAALDGAAPGSTTATPPADPDCEALLCEFDYDLKPTPTFPLLDGTKEQRAYYWLKRYGLPALYWQGMLRGLG
jgi:sulfide:quinone oxidoreductase